MKTKLLLTIFGSCSFYLLSSQIPQGFNYQAIARDGSGASIVNKSLPVKITIQTSLTGGTTIWEEQHSSITSNQFGMISLVVGTGTKLSGTAATFSAIDWNAQTLYLKTTIQYPGTTWTVMGTTQIWSVPYSMVAKDVEGPITKLGITGTTSSLEEALFEVKNKDGQTIFAVYNEGVRVYVADGKKGAKGGFAVGGFGTSKAESQKFLYVDADSIRAYIYDDPKVKGAKGGFAVGGFSTAKSLTNDYMLISPDSIRMYIDDTGKGAKGGFAVGGFNAGKGEGAHFLDVATDASGIINPSENRVLWYPLKNAFLTGKVLIQKPDSVGENSFASGYESKAIGDWSQALGYKTVARGDYSTAIGKNSSANGESSFAFGNQAKTTGIGSYAFGTGARATGSKSFALGSVGIDSTGKPTGATVASGEAAFALGFGSVASYLGACAFGVIDTASGPFSLAMGYMTKSKSAFSTTFGAGTVVEPAGWNGLATGILTKAGNWAACAFGDKTYASGHTSFATGFSTTASGQLSSTFGDQTKASGYASTAFGYLTTAQAFGSMVIGRYNLISGSSTIWNSGDPVFVIGNGTSTTARSNAMTVYKDGDADIGGHFNINNYINLNRGVTSGIAMFVNNDEALWYDGSTFSWGYGGTYNVFGDRMSIGSNYIQSTYGLHVTGSVYATGGWAGSDARWKKDLEPLQNILPGVVKLQGFNYNWRDDEYPDMNFDKGRQIGLIAQEVEKIFPELVKTDDNGYKAVSYEKLTVILLEGMKEQQKQIESQNEKIAALEKLVNDIIPEKE